jgi:hypothetical protein
MFDGDPRRLQRGIAQTCKFLGKLRIKTQF